MQIGQDTVVSLSYELFDAQGKLIEKTKKPIAYIHGGYDGIFPLVEKALDGKSAGEACEVKLSADDAFGQYDAGLVRDEPRDLFPKNVAVGMQFEGAAEGSEHHVIYTVTKISDDKVSVDGNHPLAGKDLVFNCKVTAVRKATEEELSHGHVHGEGGHHH
jgi:FKBP-type peptidyl-prolyl cis-trans isomerase SlyD